MWLYCSSIVKKIPFAEEMDCLKEKEERKTKNENNITYYGGRNWQPIWNRNKTVGAGR